MVADMLKDNVPVSAIDNLIRANIPEDYFDYFYPGIGHGVGLEIHEEPFIRQNSSDIIKKGMVITIEPGLYISGWGGMRVEDSIYPEKFIGRS